MNKTQPWYVRHSKSKLEPINQDDSLWRLVMGYQQNCFQMQIIICWSRPQGQKYTLLAKIYPNLAKLTNSIQPPDVLDNVNHGKMIRSLNSGWWCYSYPGTNLFFCYRPFGNKKRKQEKSKENKKKRDKLQDGHSWLVFGASGDSRGDFFHDWASVPLQLAPTSTTLPHISILPYCHTNSNVSQ